MCYINRMVVVVRPKPAFVEWANALPDMGDMKFTVKELNEDCSVFLIPDFPDDRKATNYIKKMCDDIFSRELESICTLEDWWPQKRNWKMFREWFEIEIHSSVLDMTDSPIQKEEN